MSLLRINRNPTRAQLNVFAVAWLVVFAALGLVLWSRGDRAGATVCLLAAMLLPAFGLIAPGALRAVYLTAALATWPIGWVLSHVILALVYYGVVAPIGLVMRALGRDPLERRFDRDASTYWTPRPEPTDDPERHFRQY